MVFTYIPLYVILSSHKYNICNIIFIYVTNIKYILLQVTSRATFYDNI
jgi:hypothetical protein